VNGGAITPAEADAFFTSAINASFSAREESPTENFGNHSASKLNLGVFNSQNFFELFIAIQNPSNVPCTAVAVAAASSSFSQRPVAVE